MSENEPVLIFLENPMISLLILGILIRLNMSLEKFYKFQRENDLEIAVASSVIFYKYIGK